MYRNFEVFLCQALIFRFDPDLVHHEVLDRDPDPGPLITTAFKLTALQMKKPTPKHATWLKDWTIVLIWESSWSPWCACCTAPHTWTSWGGGRGWWAAASPASACAPPATTRDRLTRVRTGQHQCFPFTRTAEAKSQNIFRETMSICLKYCTSPRVCINNISILVTTQKNLY